MQSPDQQQEQQPNDESSRNISDTSISESQANKDLKKFPCSQCEKVYTIKKSLQKHVRIKHNMSNTTVAQNEQDGVNEEQLSENKIDDLEILEIIYPTSKKVCRNLPVKTHFLLFYSKINI